MGATCPVMKPRWFSPALPRLFNLVLVKSLICASTVDLGHFQDRWSAESYSSHFLYFVHTSPYIAESSNLSYLCGGIKFHQNLEARILSGNYMVITQTTLNPVTLAIIAFGFSALVVVDAPRFLVVKGKYSLTLSLKKAFQVWFLYSPSMIFSLCYE
jgi:hypothetical protein